MRRHSHRLLGIVVVVAAFYALHHPWVVSGLEAAIVGNMPADQADIAPASQRVLPAALPSPSLTPGAINPQVTQANIYSTICRRGWTRTIRPPEEYTETLKRQQIAEYGYADDRLGDYEEDHLVSLELGGSPTSPANLWPEPHYAPGGWGSYAKDRLENTLNHLVCDGRLTLSQAQQAIASDWIAAYQRYIDTEPDNTPTY